MKITFLGATRIVTGSCYLVEVENVKFLVDCGMFQGKKETVKKNYENFHFDPREVDFVLLTHAHLDHSGCLPKLVKHGFTGKIYCTPSTKDLCRIMLTDSAHIQEVTTAHENRRRERVGLPKREQLYDEEDVVHTLEKFEKIHYDEKFKVNDNVTISFRDAGHILGSAMIQTELKDGDEIKKIVFSGDIGQDHSLIVRDAAIIEESDYVFIESTYGNRVHEFSDKRLEMFEKVINDTYEKGGKLLIPSFAIERTQELLYSLHELFEQNKIPDMKIFLDSPLAIKATEIFKKHKEDYDAAAQSLKSNPFVLPNLVCTQSVDESKTINYYHKPAIIIAGSGMCNDGRIRHHIKHNVWDARNTILFVGFQAEGTLGNVILSGEKHVKMMGMDFMVKLKVEEISAFSAHADKNMLINWVKHFKKIKKFFVVHGEYEANVALAEEIKNAGYESHVPELYDTIEL